MTVRVTNQFLLLVFCGGFCGVIGNKRTDKKHLNISEPIFSCGILKMSDVSLKQSRGSTP